jgi:hypothetical protein
MKKVWNILLFILNLLNWWLLKIPSRFSVLALVGYNLFIYFAFGRWSIDAVQEALGFGTYKMALFHIFISFPMFWSFICCWSGAKMVSSNFRKNNTSALDNSIEYRNGQVSNQTAQDAFETMKKTAVLDQMKANKGNPTMDKAIQGFNAKYGNESPTKVYDGLTKKDE